MSDHIIEWSPAPKPVVPEIATAVDVVEARLVGFDGFGAPIHEQVLSDSPDRVLRASHLAPGTFEGLVARLSDDERHALLRRMQ